MRPVVELQLVENESKDKIYAEENKVLTLRLVNSRPWNEEKQLENYKVGVSLHGKKVEISYGQMRACEILYKVSVEVPGTYTVCCMYKSDHVLHSPMNIVVKSKSALESNCSEENNNKYESMSRRSSLVQLCQEYKMKRQAEDLKRLLNSSEGPSIPRNVSICGSTETAAAAPDLQNLTKVSSWKKVLSIPNGGGKGVNKPIGICILASKQIIIVASTFEDKTTGKDKARGKVKMFLMDGTFLKEVICPDVAGGSFVRPSDMASISDEKFAVRDSSRIMIFDDTGEYVKTVWTSTEGMRCYGLVLDDKHRLVCLMEKSFNKQLYIQRYDLEADEALDKIDLADILDDKYKNSKCRFLTFHGGKFFVTDNGLNKVYVVNVDSENDENVSIEEFSMPSDDIFNDPGGVIVDNFDNIVVADSKNHRLCLFNSDFKWIRNIQVRFKHYYRQGVPPKVSHTNCNCSSKLGKLFWGGTPCKLHTSYNYKIILISKCVLFSPKVCRECSDPVPCIWTEPRKFLRCMSCVCRAKRG